ncbi:MAG: NepR family anti-sigma factor [Brevundimonas sp.]
MPKKSAQTRSEAPKAKSVDEALRAGFEAVERQPAPDHLVDLVDRLSGKRRDPRS